MPREKYPSGLRLMACHAMTQASAIVAAIAPPRQPNSNAIITTGMVFSARTASVSEAAVARRVIVAMKTAIATTTIRARRVEGFMGEQ